MVYILRLMAHAPEAGERGPEAEPGPIRTAGITPAPQVARPRAEPARREAAMAIDFDLTVVWALLLAFAVSVYVVLDGFDLGIGILFPFFPEKRDRDLLMNSVAPVWDGNETWLVLGGGGLLAAFPLAYAIIMPALYPPVIAMLLGADLPRRRLRVPLARRAAAHQAGSGTGPSSAARWSPRSRRASPSARCCRASRSRAAPMPAAGGTG